MKMTDHKTPFCRKTPGENLKTSPNWWKAWWTKDMAYSLFLFQEPTNRIKSSLYKSANVVLSGYRVGLSEKANAVGLCLCQTSCAHTKHVVGVKKINKRHAFNWKLSVLKTTSFSTPRVSNKASGWKDRTIYMSNTELDRSQTFWQKPGCSKLAM